MQVEHQARQEQAQWHANTQVMLLNAQLALQHRQEGSLKRRRLNDKKDALRELLESFTNEDKTQGSENFADYSAAAKKFRAACSVLADFNDDDQENAFVPLAPPTLSSSVLASLPGLSLVSQHGATLAASGLATASSSASSSRHPSPAVALFASPAPVVAARAPSSSTATQRFANEAADVLMAASAHVVAPHSRRGGGGGYGGAVTNRFAIPSLSTSSSSSSSSPPPPSSSSLLSSSSSSSATQRSRAGRESQPPNRFE